MKISVLYYSKTGCTKEMADSIIKGIEKMDVEAKSMSIEDIDDDFLKKSSCVIIGSPTYFASIAHEVKDWLDSKSAYYNLSGKLAGAFATENYMHGGGDLAIQNMLTHFMVLGMMTYSGGGAYGNPPIHLGPVARFEDRDKQKDTFEIYGERMATKAKELFSCESESVTSL